MESPDAPSQRGAPPTEDEAFVALVRGLRAGGEKFALRPQWATWPGGLTISPPFVTDRSDDRACRLRLMVPTVVPLGDRYTLYPLADGEGATLADALAAAVAAWAATALPLFRAAMADTPEAPAGGGFQVDVSPSGRIKAMRMPAAGTVERFALERTGEPADAGGGGDARWHAYCGPPAWHGPADDTGAVSEHLSHLPTLAMLLRGLHGALNAGAVHWLQLLVTHRPDGLIVTCLLNNEPWDVGQAALRTAFDVPYPWPRSGASCGFLQYLVLRPVAG